MEINLDISDKIASVASALFALISLIVTIMGWGGNPETRLRGSRHTPVVAGAPEGAHLPQVREPVPSAVSRDPSRWDRFSEFFYEVLENILPITLFGNRWAAGGAWRIRAVGLFTPTLLGFVDFYLIGRGESGDQVSSNGMAIRPLRGFVE